MEGATVATQFEIPSTDPASYCRLCLSSLAVEPLFPGNFQQDLLELIANNVQVVLDVDEDLPCAVCRCCRERLEDFERFREQCRKLHELLRQRRRELEQVTPIPEVVMEVSEEVAIKMDPEDDGLPYVLMDDGWHQCKFCSEAFLSLSVLVEHFRMRHPEESKMYKCPSCSRTYSSQVGVGAEEASFPAYKCNECDTRFSNRLGMARHWDRYHEKSSPNYTTVRIKCERCPAVFVDDRQRTRHQLQAHLDGNQSAGKPETGHSKIEGIHVCEKCAVTFSPYQALLVHIQEHHWNDPPQDTTFNCSVCAKTFEKRRLLQYHILAAHLGQVPFACNHCGEWFRTKSQLKQHKNIFHDQRSSGMATTGCESCGQTLEEGEGERPARGEEGAVRDLPVL